MVGADAKVLQHLLDNGISYVVHVSPQSPHGTSSRFADEPDRPLRPSGSTMIDFAAMNARQAAGLR